MHAVSKAAAQSHLHGTDEAQAGSSEFRSKGLQEAAEALIKHEAQWAGHSLGDVATVKATAELAQEMHGEEAVDILKTEGNKLYKSNSVAKAVVKWRAAIWLMFNKQYSSDLYYLWDILNSRHTLWEKVCIYFLQLWYSIMLCADAIARGSLCCAVRSLGVRASTLANKDSVVDRYFASVERTEWCAGRGDVHRGGQGRPLPGLVRFGDAACLARC